MYLWIGAGLLLNLAAVVIWYFVFRGPEPETDNSPTQIHKKSPPKKPNKPQGAS